MIGKVCGTGAYIPEKIVTNFDMAEIVETNDEWIRERTGVARRHIAVKETTSQMAAEAARKALKDAGIYAEEVDMILVATLSPDLICPSIACEVQRILGAKKAVCYDMNAACTGFVFAFQAAQAYIQAGMYHKILVIGAESISNLIDWNDRSTCILFGDGAGAIVLCAQKEETEGSFRPVFAAHSDGERGTALLCRSRYHKEGSDFYEISQKKAMTILEDSYIRMDGQAVFKFAVRCVPEVIREVLEKAKTSISDVKYFVLHQANRRIVEAAAKRLGADIEKFPMNLEEYGNTSSASIPILLEEMNRKNMLTRGDTIVLAGFGAGLSWGAVIFEW